MKLSQVVYIEKQEDVAEKKKSVQNALDEMEKREEQLKLLHDREQQDKEDEVLKRKEETEVQMKNKILSANR